jgi:hypothetical protein
MSPHVNQPRFENDLDRVLGEWFAEGPRRAPEAPMTGAVAWARAHPRRRDPFLALRRDPMGGRSVFAPLLQPGWAAAVVGMLLIAVVAIGVGSQRPQQPPPSVSSSPSPTTSPSVTPLPAPTPFDVELEVVAGGQATVRVTDQSGTLVEARTGAANPDGASVGEGTAQVTQIDATTIEVRWLGLPCRSRYALTILAGPELQLAITPCAGVTDTFPMDRVLLLEFASPVDAATVQTTVTGSLLPTASPS